MVCNPVECCRASRPVAVPSLPPFPIGKAFRPVTTPPRPAASAGSAISATNASPTAVQERQRVRQPYPNYRVIVLDDNINTFQHVVDCLVRHLPGMQPDRAWELAHRIDGEGSAVVWRGPQEQAELYHQLLGGEGLTMAPLERD
ncbi:ATP-dependent Clp protease adapter ClpS [Synechococcus sp. CBW1004]|jgi:ATP-dependent Clp protease adaptor protein ClpS|nr:ATP-dependent Clp protease adapter ClpS [Synechococcus sp. CBW1004]